MLEGQQNGRLLVMNWQRDGVAAVQYSVGRGRAAGYAAQVSVTSGRCKRPRW